VRVRALSIHADYGCRHSGACCRSGWDIPVEPEIANGLDAAVARGLLPAEPAWARPLPGLPHGARVLRVSREGECVFREPRACAVHARLGAQALPSACLQFPRVATLTPLGVSVTLSHYCPTAAELLFRDDRPLVIVDAPEAFPASWPYEGLDARQAFPPLLRPGVLTSWRSHVRLEAHAVATFARSDCAPEVALVSLATTVERLRAWTPADGPFDAFADEVLESPGPPATASPRSLEGALAEWERAAASIPATASAPESPRRALRTLDRDRLDAVVDAGYSRLHAPVRRWLAAKAFGSWVALQGDGVRTTVASLRLALGVLRAEAARGCADAARELDAPLLKEAFRRSDLLLQHLVDVHALARELSRCEAAG
jgi:hypothetical protein